MSLSENTTYVFALGLLKGIGAQNHRALVRHFSTRPALEAAPHEQLNKILRPSLATSIYEQVHSSSVWEELLDQAETMLQKHLQQGITPIPITSSDYSPLLKKIPDPPVMLYAKGNIALLQSLNAVAIVGTREPTPKGANVARHLAHYMAQQDFCIVSGLAKGIDTAAHQGALDVQGKTIAVYATPLDTVYPAENRGLARRILDADGLVVGELPLGQKSFRSAFVLRDRIQSGLSLSVIPVQTSIDGGTMHTVKFAKEQSRLVACPVPLKDEAHYKQYEGIFSLMKEASPQIFSFRAGKVEESGILVRLQEIKKRIVPYYDQEAETSSTVAEESATDTTNATQEAQNSYQVIATNEAVLPSSPQPETHPHLDEPVHKEEQEQPVDTHKPPEATASVADASPAPNILPSEPISKGPARTVTEKEQVSASKEAQVTEVVTDTQADAAPESQTVSVKADQLYFIKEETNSAEEPKKKTFRSKTPSTQKGEVKSKPSRSRSKKKAKQEQTDNELQAPWLPETRD